MKALFVLSTLIFSLNALAVDGKTLIFCDDNDNGIYMDIYFDYDATLAAYVNPEVGILTQDTSTYPDYLWSVVSVMNPNDPAAALLSVVKAEHVLSFSFPATVTQVNNEPVTTYMVSKTDDKVDDFDLAVKGAYMGAILDSTFTCYDPGTRSKRPLR